MIIILCGHRSLEHTTSKSYYSALTSRLLFQTTWQPIDDSEEFSKYIQTAFKNAGKQETIISQSGMQLLHMASKGRLRNAHKIITQALHMAALGNMNHLSDDIIQQSIEESQA